METTQKIEASQLKENLSVVYVPLASLRNPERNPRKWTKEATEQLKESIKKYGVVDPLVVNSAPERNGIVVGGNFRMKALKEMGFVEVPVVYVNIPDPKKEEELIIRLNRNEEDILALFGDKRADMCFTDPPYILDYLHGKTRNGKPTEGFGAKRNRRYLETDVLPDNFTELWMANIAKIQKENFHIIVYENWKNIPTIWSEMAKRWKVKNMLVWHLPNRMQGFAAKYKFFSKHDIAMVGSTENNSQINIEPEEEELLQNEYETALYAIAGKPHWEGYEKGKKTCPTDFVEFNAADEKNSGQGIIFGTKPVEILIPYIKMLTKRNDLIVEPFGGSGSTLIAATKMKRFCYLMEKSPVYAEVIKSRWEKLTGLKAQKIYEKQ